MSRSPKIRALLKELEQDSIDAHMANVQTGRIEYGIRANLIDNIIDRIKAATNDAATKEPTE